MLLCIGAQGAPTHLVDEYSVEISKTESGIHRIDFGRVAFGNLRLTPAVNGESEITVHFGESLVKGRINRKPQGTVRYNQTTLVLKGKSPVVVAPPPDKRNTRASRNPPAVEGAFGRDGLSAAGHTFTRVRAEEPQTGIQA